MDIKNYIASGMIEGYLFGLATPEERAEFERRLKIEPELQVEFERAQNSLLLYQKQFELSVPEEMEEQIWEKLAATPQRKDDDRQSMIASAEQMVAKRAPIIVRMMPFVVAASLALFSISAYMAYNYYSQLKNMQQQMADLEIRSKQLAQELGAQKSQLSHATGMLNMFNQPGMSVVKLAGKEISPQSSIMLYWNKTTTELILNDINLPAAPSGKEYQLWAIVDGKPVSIGMITIVGPDHVVKMKKSIPKPSAFAITLEQSGGVEIPTMEQMFVAGNI